MRFMYAFLFGLLIAAALVGLGIVVVRNPQSEQIDLLGTSLQAGVGWVVAIAAGVGFLLAFLLLIPGRLGSAFRSWGLSRQGQALEANLQALREQHAHLQGRHKRLMEEHADMINQIVPSAMASTGSVAATGNLRDVHAGTAEPLPRTPAPLPTAQQRLGGKLSPSPAARSSSRLSSLSSSSSFGDRVRQRIRTMRMQLYARWERLRATGQRAARRSSRSGTDQPDQQKGTDLRPRATSGPTSGPAVPTA